MDNNTDKIYELQLQKTKQALIKNNMEAYVVQDANEAKQLILSMIPSNSSVSVGGSMTLFETGIIELLRNMHIDFMDRYAPGLSPQEMKQIYRETFLSDYYISSTNAITLEGELYNVDGNGNRVAAITYGPEHVIIVASRNKIVANIEEAHKRVQQIAAPSNCVRLQRQTPCAKVGYCVDCQSEERICCSFVVHRQQINKNRIKVILVNEDFGY